MPLDVVGTDDGHYEFNADFDRFHEFIRELTHHLYLQHLEAVAPKGMILWEHHDEFLARTVGSTDLVTGAPGEVLVASQPRSRGFHYE